MKRFLSIITVIAIFLSLYGCADFTQPQTPTTAEVTNTPPPATSTAPATSPTPSTTLTSSPSSPVSVSMQAYFFDVGQADATLLLGHDFTVLIDAGDYTGNDVVPYLQSAGVKEIDLLIGTHPHADHIGQFPQVLDTFTVKEVWLSGDAHTSRTFENALDAVLASDAVYHEPRAGESFEFGSLQIEVVHPAHITGDFHEGSISIKAAFGSISFVLTGDAEVAQEREMISRGHDLQAQVLQLGHHGSSTSSCREFLEAVDPEVAIYSAGEDNSYGHPHEETVQLLSSMGIPLYGTDVHGTIVVVTDGKTYSVSAGDMEVIMATSGAVTKPDDGSALSGGCASGQININTASLEMLHQIVHIGPERAQELVSLRPFSSLDDLSRVSGIGPSRIKDIKTQGLACCEDGL
jgi:competence protein ComEC